MWMKCRAVGKGKRQERVAQGCSLLCSGHTAARCGWSVRLLSVPLSSRAVFGLVIQL